MGKSDRRCPSDIFEALCPRCVHREGCVVRTAGPDLFSELGPTALTTTVALLQTKRPGDLLPDAGGLRVEVLVTDCEAFEENTHRTEEG
jgi:hypothetical protein